MDITQVVSITEQLVNEFQYALDTVITELNDYLGPDAVAAMVNQPPPPEGALPPRPRLPRPPPAVPIRVPDGIPRDDLVVMVKKIKQLDYQHDEQIVGVHLISKLSDYAAWVVDSAYGCYDSPLYDQLRPIIPIIKRYQMRLLGALESFKVNWESLRRKLDSSCPSATTAPDAMSARPRDNWQLTVQMFEQLIENEY